MGDVDAEAVDGFDGIGVREAGAAMTASSMTVVG